MSLAGCLVVKEDLQHADRLFLVNILRLVDAVVAMPRKPFSHFIFGAVKITKDYYNIKYENSKNRYIFRILFNKIKYNSTSWGFGVLGF